MLFVDTEGNVAHGHRGSRDACGQADRPIGPFGHNQIHPFGSVLVGIRLRPLAADVPFGGSFLVDFDVITVCDALEQLSVAVRFGLFLGFCVGDFNLVPNVAQKREVNVALSNSFGFGGTNASLILKRIK